MRIALIYATWPDTPFGMTWHKFAASTRTAGLSEQLATVGHKVEEHVLTVSGPQAAELRGAFELAREIGRVSRQALAEGAFPVIVSGSCAVAAIGAIAGIGEKRTGMLWMDTHPDLNTPETTSSGLFDGMAVSISVGACWKHMAADVAGLRRPIAARDLCLYGARDIDPGESHYIRSHEIPLIHSAGLVRMEVIRRRYRNAEDDKAWIAPLASRLCGGFVGMIAPFDLSKSASVPKHAA